MDNNSSHGYMSENVGFDEFMSNTGWPDASGDQYSFQQAQPAQHSFGQYTQPQPSFDHYDVSQQPSYSLTSFSNPVYSSQYQNGRPSDKYATPTSYGLDPNLQNAYRGTQGSFSFAPGPAHTSTISPQSLQYGVHSNQSLNQSINQPVNHDMSGNGYRSASISGGRNTLTYDFDQVPQVDQAPQNQTAMYFDNSRNTPQQSISNGFSFASREASQPVLNQTLRRQVENSGQLNSPRAQQLQNQVQQHSVRAIHPTLNNMNGYSQPRKLQPYLMLADQPIQIDTGLKNTIPKYHPRKSRSGKILVPGLDMSKTTTTQLPKQPLERKRTRPPKVNKVLVSKVKSAFPGIGFGDKIAALRIDGSVKSPSTPTETSTSEEDTSSEEESEYEVEMPPPVDISTVREATCPSDVPGAVRWNTIGIVWKDPNSSPSAEVIKGAIEEYGTLVTSLRAQLKKNVADIEEATKSPVNQSLLQQLKDTRGVRLETLYQAITTANQLGYTGIIENLGGHHKLVNGLTTTLIECIRTDDFLGKLPKAVFRLLSKFQTMTDELLERLKFGSIQKRWSKKADGEISNAITSIVANTTNAKERAAKRQKDAVKAEENALLVRKIEQNKLRNAESVKALTSPVKRPHDGDGSNGKPNKKLATESSVALASSKPATKRTTNLLANNLLGNSSKPTLKPVIPKKRTSSPPTESKLGALLDSIAKPPEPPKPAASPTRPAETPEEKKLRERKESRRHLRVRFKEGAELQEVRLFRHEQAEDEGREDPMLRDAHDDRSEGMTLKKRLETMDRGLDEDEDRPYPELVEIDLGGLGKSTLHGPAYTTRGGNLVVNTQEQETQKRREALELMVIYNDEADIPPSPKEPPAAESGFLPEKHVIGQPTAPWLTTRLQYIHLYGPQASINQGLTRLHLQEQEQRSRNFLPSNAQSPSVSAILHQLGAPKQDHSITQSQNIHRPPTKVMDPDAYANLLRIVNSVKGKPYPPVEPPDWMTTAGKAEWWQGFNRDKASKEAKEREAGNQQNNQMQAAVAHAPSMVSSYQQPMPTPQMAAPQMSTPQMGTPQMQGFPQHVQHQNLTFNIPAGQTSTDANQQMQNFLATLKNNDKEVGDVTYQEFDFNSWSKDPQGYANQMQQAYQSNENKRPSNRDSNKQRGDHDKNNLFDQNGDYKGKKRTCRFYKEGKCAKGNKCTFLHE